MATPRPSVPKAVRERLMREFNHRCAICGEAPPHVHHIDEDSSNNDILNLLPLCPNHHLNDQHNPTKGIEPGRLALFRKHKDPQILAPQFSPVYARISYLLLPRSRLTYEQLMAASTDLIRFVEQMQMGGYYAKSIGDLLDSSWPMIYRADDTKVAEEQLRTAEAAYRKQIDDRRDQVVHLVIEQLRYQQWPRYEG